MWRLTFCYFAAVSVGRSNKADADGGTGGRIAPVWAVGPAYWSGGLGQVLTLVFCCSQGESYMGDNVPMAVFCPTKKHP